MTCSLWRLQGAEGSCCWSFDVSQNYRLMCACWTGRDQSFLKRAKAEAWPQAGGLQMMPSPYSSRPESCLSLVGFLSHRTTAVSRKGGWGSHLSISMVTSLNYVHRNIQVHLGSQKGPRKKISTLPGMVIIIAFVLYVCFWPTLFDTFLISNPA